MEHLCAYRRLSDHLPHHYGERQRSEGLAGQLERAMLVGELAAPLKAKLNDLLTIVNGHLDLARGALPPDHPAQADLGSAQAAGSLLGMLVTQLLGSLTPGGPSLAPLGLRRRILQRAPLVRKLLPTDVRLRLALSRELWEVWADPVLTDQVLLTLFVALAQCMSEGGVISLRGRNCVVTATPGLKAGEYVRLELSGKAAVGVPADRSLALCRCLLEQQGGTLVEPGGVGGFQIYLPRHSYA